MLVKGHGPRWAVFFFAAVSLALRRRRPPSPLLCPAPAVRPLRCRSAADLPIASLSGLVEAREQEPEQSEPWPSAHCRHRRPACSDPR